MGMHTIPVIYDPTTRRISLTSNTDTYGGATTDTNSVTISVTGIEPEGTNFIARVDFAVLVETGNRVVNRPFVLLEQIENRWEAVIPNAILRATKDVHRLPIQLILANDSQVINSRNTIVLETTTAIDATASGDEIPDYEMPDWPLPTGVSESLDVLTLDVTYDPLTRMISLPDNDTYGGTTIDTNSVRINVTGIPSECDARLDFATAIRVDNSTVIKPFVVLDNISTVFSAMIPQSVLMAAKETKKLPFQLVTRHGDTVINSRNTIVLEITRAINAMESVESAYTPYVMYRNDTWAWVADFTYDTGAVVTYDGDIYVATQPSMGQRPSDDSEYWKPSVGEAIVTLNGYRVNDPEFYAPLLSGISGQYLESRGENNSPEWVSKVTEIDTDSNGVPTVTAVKGHVAASVAVETERAIGAESQLQINIESEAGIRSGVDAALSERISTLETETVNANGTYLTKSGRSLSHNTTSRTDTTTSPDPAAISNGGHFYIVDTVSTDGTAGGHVTGVNKTKITLPTYAAAAGIKLDGLTFKHTNVVTADSTGKGSASKSATVKMDAQGHITALTDQDIQIVESQVTDLPNDLAGKAPKNHAGQDTQQDPYPYGKAAAQAYGHVQFDGTVSGNRTDVTISEKGIKDFVNSSINALAAYYITKNAAGDPFATHAELMASTTVYSGGAPRVPTRNDYCIVMADETNGNGDSTRYTYNSDSTTYSSANWAYQYTFNKQFTAAQLAALDSGITDGKVNAYDAHITNTSNPHSVTKAQVGLGNVENYGPVSAWQSTPDNTHIPTEKLTKDTLDTKVTGPSSAVSDNVVLFDGTTGKLVKDSGKTLGASIPAPTVGTDEGKAIIVNSSGTGFIFGEAGKVDDVQINGASIVSNKIAVIPITVADVTLADM